MLYDRAAFVIQTFNNHASNRDGIGAGYQALFVCSHWRNAFHEITASLNAHHTTRALTTRHIQLRTRAVLRC